MSKPVTEQVAAPEHPLPIVRVPMHDRKCNLVAYELQFQHQARDADEVRTNTLQAITDGSLSRLTGPNRTYVRLSRDVLCGEIDPFKNILQLGLIVTPDIADDEVLFRRVEGYANRGRQIMLDAGDHSLLTNVHAQRILKFIKAVRISVQKLSRQQLLDTVSYLSERDHYIYLTGVDDRETYEFCESLPVFAIQGQYLLKPSVVNVPKLTTGKLSLLRMLSALNDPNLGPAQIGAIVKDDAVLSYKLLGCVNSSYFGLGKQLRSVEHAAIFFGVSRMKTWIRTMALIGNAESPPELLRASLVRAHMLEKLSSHLSPAEQEMAFTTGIFSLLDVVLGAPLDFLLEHLPLAPAITNSLLKNGEPFGHLLQMMRDWEAGGFDDGHSGSASMLSMAAVYQEALVWTDNVYSMASTH